MELATQTATPCSSRTGLVKIGLIGLGQQMRSYHLPFLQQRAEREGDVEIAWISGYLPHHAGEADPYRSQGIECRPGDEWRSLLSRRDVDAVIVSLPNALHEQAIRAALAQGAHVAVDKPPTLTSATCRELTEQARRDGRIFLTISQRRYEEVYQAVRQILADGALGTLRYVQYLISHWVPGRGQASWQLSRAMAGGGALISSGYHALDVILWLLSHCPGEAPEPQAVSALCLPDHQGPPGSPEDHVESVASLRIRLTHQGQPALFNLTVSFDNPYRSLDEDIKIFGTGGAIRLVRDRLVQEDQKAPELTYQKADGTVRSYDTSGWSARREAPLEDFIEAALSQKAGFPRKVYSSAQDSVLYLRIIEQAYHSAAQGGQEMPL